MPKAKRSLEQAMADDGLPSSVEAERVLLGAMLLEPASADDIAAVVRDVDFHFTANRIIYRAMRWRIARNEPVDFVTVGAALEAAKQLEAVGGYAYLTALTEGLPPTINAGHYARIVRECAKKRELLGIAEQLAGAAMSDMEVSEAIARAVSRLGGVEDDGAPSYATLGEIGMERLDALVQRRKSADGRPSSDLLFGILSLDEEVAVERKDLLVIGGIPGAGKSSLAVQIACTNADGGKRAGLIASLEMTKEQQWDRAVSYRSGVSYALFRRPEMLRDEHMQSVTEAWSQHLVPMRVGIADDPQMTVAQIAALARQFRRKEGALDFLIVDHAQIIEGERRGQSRAEEVSGICRECKRVAKELDVPFVLLSQLRKQDEAREPRLADFLDSQGVYAHADVVLGIHRPYVYSLNTEDKGKERILILKQRQGAPGRVPVKFDETVGRWRAREWSEGGEEAESSPGTGQRRRRWQKR